MSARTGVTGAPVRVEKATLPNDYASVLAQLKQMIGDSRHRALSTVNRELVWLYWQIGRIIVQQQEAARWGDAVVEQLSADLRAAFPDFKGLSLPNLWRMRQMLLMYRRIDSWIVTEKLSTMSRETSRADVQPEILSTLSREFSSPELPRSILSLSWSHHTPICSAADRPDRQYFYLRMAVRERWSFRELQRQVESDLYTRYVSARHEPEKCPPADPERGETLPFKDHYAAARAIDPEAAGGAARGGGRRVMKTCRGWRKPRSRGAGSAFRAF